MTSAFKKAHISVKKSSIHGYGIFADTHIGANEIIEECFALFTSGSDAKLRDYVFSVKDHAVLLTGYGSIFNHADHPNVSYFFDENRQAMIFTALRSIKEGEELLISYGKNWFASRGAALKKISLLQQFWRYFKGVPLRGLLVIIVLTLMIFCARYFVQL